MSTDKQTHDIESNNAESLFKLGERYEKGEGVPQCNTEAMKYYRSAAVIAMADAKTNLAEIYDKPEYTSDIPWFLRFQSYFAQRGIALAQSDLGWLYYWGVKLIDTDWDEIDLPVDEAKALKWALLAAEQGDGNGKELFATCYKRECQRGTNIVPDNELEEVRWLTWLLDYHDDYGELVDLYLADEARTNREFTKAAKIYRVFSLIGDTEAQFKLATMHEQGEGLPKDECEAYAWLSIAASRGEKEASENLQRLSSQLTPEQVSKGQQRIDELLQRYSGLFQ